jgi:hypothetical protein
MSDCFLSLDKWRLWSVRGTVAGQTAPRAPCLPRCGHTEITDFRREGPGCGRACHPPATSTHHRAYDSSTWGTQKPSISQAEGASGGQWGTAQYVQPGPRMPRHRAVHLCPPAPRYCPPIPAGLEWAEDPEGSTVVTSCLTFKGSGTSAGSGDRKVRHRLKHDL